LKREEHQLPANNPDEAHEGIRSTVVAGNDDLGVPGTEPDDRRHERLGRPNISSLDFAEAWLVFPRDAHREILRSCFDNENDSAARRSRRCVTNADLVAATIPVNVSA
jgi:hypothetical protein